MLYLHEMQEGEVDGLAMTEEAKMCVEWLNHYIKTDTAHKVIAHYVFGHNGDCGDYGEDWMWLDDICKQVINLIESLSAQLDQVTRERDAAVEDLKYVGKIDGTFCEICKHQPEEDCEKRRFENMDCFEWCGMEKEVEG